MEGPSNKQNYIRTKRVCLHANPLFEKWLLEWKKEAEEHRSNNKYNIQRAIMSLRKFPLPVHSGDECKILSNFGDKICKMIDKKLSQFIAENGPVNWDDYIKVTNSKKKRGVPRKKDESSNKAASRVNSSDAFSETSKVTQKKRRREYIPAYRSGAHALLVALMEVSEQEDFPGYLKKDELIDAAQPLSDASFTISPMGSHYTAFSSMSTLIKKGLARREGNPSRYSLTDEGEILAQRISNGQPPSSLSSHCAEMDEEDQAMAPLDCVQPVELKSPIKVHDLSSSDNESDLEVTIIQNDKDTNECSTVSYPTPSTSTASDKSQNSDDSNSPFKNPALSFVYVDVLGRETMLKEKASVHVDLDTGFFGFLIKCKLLDLLSCKLEYQMDYTRNAPPSMTYAYLADNCAPESSPGLQESSNKAELPPKKMETNQSTNNPSLNAKDNPVDKESLTTSQPMNMNVDVFQDSQSQSFASSTENSKVSSICNAPIYKLLPGSFKVVLCVDNQEAVLGMPSTKRGTKEILINELKKHGVDFHIRKLHVGDFLWVCREVKAIGKPRELVLPFVIERKRMDDLAQSIKDGRFKEQKFRLKQTGLSFPIYLVEQFGSNYLSMPLTSCEQAVANTQIIDNFHVKVTVDQKESAAYLTVMTRYVQGLFKSKTLHCISHDEYMNISQDLSASYYNLLEFEELNSSSMKNRQLSVREMFAKHLLQLSGLSVDKATAILEKYPTPCNLLNALSNCGEQAKENLLASLKCPSSSRALGPTLSIQLARLYSRASLS